MPNGSGRFINHSKVLLSIENVFSKSAPYLKSTNIRTFAITPARRTTLRILIVLLKFAANIDKLLSKIDIASNPKKNGLAKQ